MLQENHSLQWSLSQRTHSSEATLARGDTVKTILRDHCHERPPVLKDHTFLAERPTFQYMYNWTCHQRTPVLKDHNFVANRVIFQDRFYWLQVHFHAPFYQRTLVIRTELFGQKGLLTVYTIIKITLTHCHTLLQWVPYGTFNSSHKL